MAEQWDELINALTLRGMTQTQLSHLTGIQQSQINHYAQGRRKPNVGNLLKISQALSVSCDYLTGRSQSIIALVSHDEAMQAVDYLNDTHDNDEKEEFGLLRRYVDERRKYSLI